MARRLRPVAHDDQLSIIEHLDELRTRLIQSIIVLVIAFSFCYWQNGSILHAINAPLQSTQDLNGTNHSKDPLEESARFQLKVGKALAATAPAVSGIGDSLQRLSRAPGVTAADRAAVAQETRALQRSAALLADAARAKPTNTARQPVTLGVTEPFVTTFTVAGYAALLLCLPFLLYQAYAFVLPAFSPHERRIALPLMMMVPVLFIAGVAFGYFVALPRAVNFLQNFNDANFDILIQAKDYYRFSILFLAAIGLLFQIPVGVLAITRLGIISARQLAKNRGYVILVLAIVAAVATPTPDPVTMLLAMAPLVVLFELSVLMARIFERRRERAEARAESAEHDDEDDDAGERPALDGWDAVDDDVTVS
jgi:sec-independent protein translocase protein TatC